MIFIVRFAPSLSGEMHIGNFRTMIYNYLFSVYNNGQFIIRIDDTNYAETNYVYLQKLMYLLSLLKLRSITITFQSHYLSVMYTYKQKLLSAKIAYMCICDVKTESCDCKHKQYTEGCCYINISAIHNKNEDFTYYDEVYKHITVPSKQLCDIAISRRNGQFLYNYASIVCDMHTKVTHIIRGEDHIQNTWKQIMIFKAITISNTSQQYTNISFAHLPLILDSKKAKLSKRNDSNNIMSILKSGICVDALVNYVTKLGWGYKNYEHFFIYTLNKEIFNFSRFKTANATFCMQKLCSINKWHIKESSVHINIERTITYCFINDLQVPQKIHSLNIDIINRASNIQDIYMSMLYTNDTYSVVYNDTINDNDYKQLCILKTCRTKQDILSAITHNKDIRAIIRLSLTGRKSGINELILINIMNEQTIVHRIKLCYEHFSATFA